MLVSILFLGLAGCEPLALTLLGAGAGTALRYGLDGVAYRTFTASAPEVRLASLAALERMGLTFDGTEAFEGGEVIYARSAQRTIEIDVEPISAKATRMRIAAKNGGLFYDNATAHEIVAQTARQLESTQTARQLESAARGASVRDSSVRDSSF